MQKAAHDFASIQATPKISVTDDPMLREPFLDAVQRIAK